MLTRNKPAKWKPRVEDERFVRGEGRYVDDVDFSALAYAAFVRSPYAHARIQSIDTKEALGAPGGPEVIPAADLKAAGAGNIPMHMPMAGRGGKKLVVPIRPP